MPPDFLDRLNVSEEEGKKLAGLGARTPAALLAMRQASPEAFAGHLGAARADQIAAELLALLSDEERQRLAAPLPPGRALGARLAPPAAPLRDPPYDLERRDLLFQELERLRQGAHPTPADRKRMRQLERDLEELFKGNG
jgi:hypothetical protein